MSGIFFIPLKSVYAIELYNRYTSVRALGMGNAYTPIARGTESLFYNPAGLAKTKEITFTALKFRIGANEMDAYSEVKGLDTTNFASTLRKFYGEHGYFSLGAMSGFSTPNFAIAAYDSFNMSGDFSNPALPSFQVDFVNDLGVATGFGFDIVPGFSMGFVAKRISRKGTSSEISVASLVNLNVDELKRELDNNGIGYALDWGMGWTFPTPVKPTLSFVMRDIGNTRFTLDEGIRRPPTDKSEMIAGMSLEIETSLLSITPVFEMRHINSDGAIHIGKKIHMGVEFDLPGLSLRGGLHQGYYTAGAGINLGIVNMDVATYGVELGEYPGQKEDRRYMLEFTVDFGFDPTSGSFLGLDNANRKKLKQRR